ncbi:hypothetical protein [Kitasatospora cathayae]|uniref:Uncharacterized protein n=1 Tax=Kitasatospora cathayae TaxID=3004092 RepID=A0ABY7QIY0_9ACTN|nr:hypothetical protein [Kitasatospora sp. HUAS 3-15]WBP92209.1 hypothetical protein O1G21_41105 [Kitasatospora sp. HUAS 3-15]
MNLTELEKQFPNDVATWREAGIELSDDAAHGMVRVLRQGEPIGIVRDSDRFPDRFEYCALITDSWPVAFPVGFLPPDPVKALDGERARWLSPPAPGPGWMEDAE